MSNETIADIVILEEILNEEGASNSDPGGSSV